MAARYALFGIPDGVSQFGNAGLCALLQLFVVRKAQRLRKEFLSFGGCVLGELIGLALLKVGGVDEGVVVELDGPDDQGFCIADAVGGYGPEPVPSRCLEFEHRGALSCPRSASVLSYHAVHLVAHENVERDLHVGLTLVDQLVLLAGPRASP